MGSNPGDKMLCLVHWRGDEILRVGKRRFSEKSEDRIKKQEVRLQYSVL